MKQQVPATGFCLPGCPHALAGQLVATVEAKKLTILLIPARLAQRWQSWRAKAGRGGEGMLFIPDCLSVPRAQW